MRIFLTFLFLIIVSACSNDNKGLTTQGAATSSIVDFGILKPTDNQKLMSATIYNTTGAVLEGPATISNGDFSFVAGYNCPNGAKNKTSCAAIKLTFNPQGKVAGEYNATLDLGEISIPLHATIENPEEVSLASGIVSSMGDNVDYGGLLTTASVVTKTITFTNKNQVAVLEDIDTSNLGPFNITYNKCDGVSVKAKTGTCQIKVSLNPKNNSGTLEGSLSYAGKVINLSGYIISPLVNAGEGDISLLLGSQVLSLTEAANLGSITEGVTSSLKTVTIKNISAIDYQISNLYFSSPSAVISNNGCGAILKGKTQCTIKFTVTPIMSETFNLILETDIFNKMGALTFDFVLGASARKNVVVNYNPSQVDILNSGTPLICTGGVCNLDVQVNSSLNLIAQLKPDAKLIGAKFSGDCNQITGSTCKVTVNDNKQVNVLSEFIAPEISEMIVNNNKEVSGEGSVEFSFSSNMSSFDSAFLSSSETCTGGDAITLEGMGGSFYGNLVLEENTYLRKYLKVVKNGMELCEPLFSYLHQPLGILYDRNPPVPVLLENLVAGNPVLNLGGVLTLKLTFNKKLAAGSGTTLVLDNGIVLTQASRAEDYIIYSGAVNVSNLDINSVTGVSLSNFSSIKDEYNNYKTDGVVNLSVAAHIYTMEPELNIASLSACPNYMILGESFNCALTPNQNLSAVVVSSLPAGLSFNSAFNTLEGYPTSLPSDDFGRGYVRFPVVINLDSNNGNKTVTYNFVVIKDRFDVVTNEDQDIIFDQALLGKGSYCRIDRLASEKIICRNQVNPPINASLELNDTPIKTQLSLTSKLSGCTLYSGGQLFCPQRGGNLLDNVKDFAENGKYLFVITYDNQVYVYNSINAQSLKSIPLDEGDSLEKLVIDYTTSHPMGNSSQYPPNNSGTGENTGFGCVLTKNKQAYCLSIENNLAGSNAYFNSDFTKLEFMNAGSYNIPQYSVRYSPSTSLANMYVSGGYVPATTEHDSNITPTQIGTFDYRGKKIEDVSVGRGFICALYKGGEGEDEISITTNTARIVCYAPGCKSAFPFGGFSLGNNAGVACHSASLSNKYAYVIPAVDNSGNNYGYQGYNIKKIKSKFYRTCFSIDRSKDNLICLGAGTQPMEAQDNTFVHANNNIRFISSKDSTHPIVMTTPNNFNILDFDLSYRGQCVKALEGGSSNIKVKCSGTSRVTNSETFFNIFNIYFAQGVAHANYRAIDCYRGELGLSGMNGNNATIGNPISVDNTGSGNNEYRFWNNSTVAGTMAACPVYQTKGAVKSELSANNNSFIHNNPMTFVDADGQSRDFVPKTLKMQPYGYTILGDTGDLYIGGDNGQNRYPDFMYEASTEAGLNLDFYWSGQLKSRVINRPLFLYANEGASNSFIYQLGTEFTPSATLISSYGMPTINAHNTGSVTFNAPTSNKDSVITSNQITTSHGAVSCSSQIDTETNSNKIVCSYSGSGITGNEVVTVNVKTFLADGSESQTMTYKILVKAGYNGNKRVVLISNFLSNSDISLGSIAGNITTGLQRINSYSGTGQVRTVIYKHNDLDYDNSNGNVVVKNTLRTTVGKTKVLTIKETDDVGNSAEVDLYYYSLPFNYLGVSASNYTYVSGRSWCSYKSGTFISDINPIYYGVGSYGTTLTYKKNNGLLNPAQENLVITYNGIGQDKLFLSPSHGFNVANYTNDSYCSGSTFTGTNIIKLTGSSIRNLSQTLVPDQKRLCYNSSTKLYTRIVDKKINLSDSSSNYQTNIGINSFALKGRDHAYYWSNEGKISFSHRMTSGISTGSILDYNASYSKSEWGTGSTTYKLSDIGLTQNDKTVSYDSFWSGLSYPENCISNSNGTVILESQLGTGADPVQVWLDRVNTNPEDFN